MHSPVDAHPVSEQSNASAQGHPGGKPAQSEQISAVKKKDTKTVICVLLLTKRNYEKILRKNKIQLICD